jgi:hypothetical protein
MILILRVATAAEFVGALWLWSLGLCPWLLAGTVATATLVVFLLTWSEA